MPFLTILFRYISSGFRVVVAIMVFRFSVIRRHIFMFPAFRPHIQDSWTCPPSYSSIHTRGAATATEPRDVDQATIFVCIAQISFGIFWFQGFQCWLCQPKRVVRTRKLVSIGVPTCHFGFHWASFENTHFPGRDFRESGCEIQTGCPSPNDDEVTPYFFIVTPVERKQ